MPDVARMRSEWYECIRTCSHSVDVSDPGFSQIALVTARRPRSCRCAATWMSVDVRLSRRRPRAASSASVATPDEWPCRAGNLRSPTSPKTAAMSESSSCPRSSTGRGSSSSRQARGSPARSRISAALAANVSTRLGSRTEPAASARRRPRAPLHRSRRGRRRPLRVGDPGGWADRILPKPLRRPTPVPPLGDLEQRALHTRPDADPSCDPAPDLAARRVVALAEGWALADQAVGDHASSARGESPRSPQRSGSIRSPLGRRGSCAPRRRLSRARSRTTPRSRARSPGIRRGAGDS